MSNEVDPFQQFLKQMNTLKGTSEENRRLALQILSKMETEFVPVAVAENWEHWLTDHSDDSYDWVIQGVLERKERVIVVAAEGVGKLLDLNEPVPTPDGWTTMGELRIGSKVFDRFGEPCYVVNVTETVTDAEARKVEFSDGSSITACIDHQWVTNTYANRQRPREPDCRKWAHGVVTTAEIEETLMAREGHTTNHAIAVSGPLQYFEKTLPLDPYTLGVWLGDGTSLSAQVSLNHDDDIYIISQIPYVVGGRQGGKPNCSTRTIHGISGLLRSMNLKSNKHIPREYLEARVDQRLALLQGLMDTDGYAPTNKGEGRGFGASSIELCFTNQTLANDAYELIQGLGHIASMKSSPAAYTLGGVRHITGTRYRIVFQSELPVFSLPRKAEKLVPLRTQRSKLRYITSVTPVPSIPMRCIQVDSPDNTYLAGRNLIPTHNSVMGRQIAISAGAGLHPFTGEHIRPVKTLTIDLENPEKIVQRSSRRIVKLARERTKHKEILAKLLLKPDGINLLSQTGKDWLERVIEHNQPEILFIGPLYKSFIEGSGRTAESTASEVAFFYDYLRHTYGCALWLEQHAPLGNAVTGRDLRPFGSAVWSRWPEFGITIMKDETDPQAYKFGVFRGSRDETRKWPLTAHRGTSYDMPFVIDSFT